jgi:hypothetical protein
MLLRRLLDQEHRAAVFLNAVRFRTGLQAADAVPGERPTPLHKESTPSFKISFKIYSDQHAYCYGCGWYGDVTSLYAALDGATKKETAFNLLGGIGGPIWTAKSNQVDQIPRREKPPLIG